MKTTEVFVEQVLIGFLALLVAAPAFSADTSCATVMRSTERCSRAGFNP